MKSVRGLMPVFLLVSLALSTGPALADTPSPTPTPTPSVSPTPTPTPSPTPTPVSSRTPEESPSPSQTPTPETSDTPDAPDTPEASPSPSVTPEESPSPDSSPSETSDDPSPSPSASTDRTPKKKSVERQAATTLSLKVAPSGTPQKGKYFSDIGYFAFSGKVSNGKADQTVRLYWWSDTAKAWQAGVAVKTTTGGAYSGKQKVGHAKIGLKLRTSLGGGKPGSPGVIYSNRVDVDVRQSYIRLASIPDVDALKTRRIVGWVYPARSGVTARLAVKVGGSYKLISTNPTNSEGKFAFNYTRGKGDLASYRVRASYKAANRGH